MLPVPFANAIVGINDTIMHRQTNAENNRFLIKVPPFYIHHTI